MTANTEQQGSGHFPEDRDAPFVKNDSFLIKFYHDNKRLIDLVFFVFMLVLTLFTVLFSIYIISSKYL